MCIIRTALAALCTSRPSVNGESISRRRRQHCQVKDHHFHSCTTESAVQLYIRSTVGHWCVCEYVPALFFFLSPLPSADFDFLSADTWAYTVARTLLILPTACLCMSLYVYVLPHLNTVGWSCAILAAVISFALLLPLTTATFPSVVRCSCS